MELVENNIKCCTQMVQASKYLYEHQEFIVKDDWIMYLLTSDTMKKRAGVVLDFPPVSAQLMPVLPNFIRNEMRTWKDPHALSVQSALPKSEDPMKAMISSALGIPLSSPGPTSKPVVVTTSTQTAPEPIQLQPSPILAQVGIEPVVAVAVNTSPPPLATVKIPEVPSSSAEPITKPEDDDTEEEYEEMMEPASKKRIVEAKKKKTSTPTPKADQSKVTLQSKRPPPLDMNTVARKTTPVLIAAAAPAPALSPITRSTRRSIGKDMGLESIDGILRKLDEQRSEMMKIVLRGIGCFPTNDQVFQIFSLFNKFPEHLTLEPGFYDYYQPSRAALFFNPAASATSSPIIPAKTFFIPYVGIAAFNEVYDSEWKAIGHENLILADPNNLDMTIHGYLYTYKSAKDYTMTIPASETTPAKPVLFKLVKKCWRLDLTGQKDLQRLTLTIIMPEIKDPSMWQEVVRLNEKAKISFPPLKIITSDALKKY